MRRLFLDSVMAALETAQGHVELIILYEGFEPIFEKMRAGEEYDQMVMNIINVRYNALHERIDEQREWVAKILAEHEERKLVE